MYDRVPPGYRGEGRGGRPDEWFFGPGGGHDSWVGDLVQTLIVILVIAALTLAVVWLVRRLFLAGGAAVAPAVAAPPAAVAALEADPAIAALRLRYARGEVASDDYQRVLADLTGSRTDTWPGQAAHLSNPRLDAASSRGRAIRSRRSRRRRTARRRRPRRAGGTPRGSRACAGTGSATGTRR